MSLSVFFLMLDSFCVKTQLLEKFALCEITNSDLNSKCQLVLIPPSKSSFCAGGRSIALILGGSCKQRATYIDVLIIS